MIYVIYHPIQWTILDHRVFTSNSQT